MELEGTEREKVAPILLQGEVTEKRIMKNQH